MNKKLSTPIQNMLDILCHNLAQYQYLYQRYEPLHHVQSFNEFLNFATEKTYLEAQKRQQLISDLSKQLKKEKNQNIKEFIQNQIDHLQNSFIGNIYKIAGNKSFARHITKNTLWLNEFEPVFANQKKEARPFDSAGRINLFGNTDKNAVNLSKCLHYHYRPLSSNGPVFETNTLMDKAGSEKVDLLISEKKPPKPVYHQIWINDELMLKSTFKTDKSLSEYLNNSYDANISLIFLTAYAQEIFNHMGNNRSQETLYQEYLNKRLEYAKTKNANYLEQYLLISTEMFCKIIQELKIKNKLPTNVPVFDDINQATLSQNILTPTDVKQMETYLSIRDHFAHPTEYNFKPFSSLNQKTNLLKDFKNNMVYFLSTALDIPQTDIEKKINGFQEETHYDVYSLLLLMDMRKALRELCVKKANLNADQPNVFLKLGFIDKKENKELINALKIRNNICHEKLNAQLAQKAQQATQTILPIIEKISDCISKKFHISVNAHYHPTLVSKTTNFSDIQQEFPFLNIDMNNDPDSHILYETLKAKQPDQKLLQELYLLAHLFQSITLTDYTLQNNPYFEEKELIPILKEYQSFKDNNSNNFRKNIFKAFANNWLATGKLPSLKKEYTRS
ncbi:MAG: hypothetical protein J6V53_05930 [Alphaproteobacteria bacterium]|nr:hypothetical protein [Alphaproteobacteria bacterium]